MYPCTPPEDIESAPTDIVVSRNQSSVRFGDLTYMTSKGDVCVSKTLHGLSVGFETPVYGGLGVRYDREFDSVVVYVDNQVPSCKLHEVCIVASNLMSPDFITKDCDTEHPKTGHLNREGYTKIEPDEDGLIENIYVKGSMIVDHYVHLNKADTPLGWFSGEHSQHWYQPHSSTVTQEKQKTMAIAKAGDIVISIGTASVLFAANGNIHTSGPVWGLVIQGVPCRPIVVFV